jgi:hypothetical protein
MTSATVLDLSAFARDLRRQHDVTGCLSDKGDSNESGSEVEMTSSTSSSKHVEPDQLTMNENCSVVVDDDNMSPVGEQDETKPSSAADRYGEKTSTHATTTVYRKTKTG